MKLANTHRMLAGVFAVALICLAMPRDAAAGEKETKLREVAVDDITLKVPAGWKQSEPTSRLRKAQFAIPAAEGDKEDAELVVYFFGGAGGGVDANIKRWIGQFQEKDRTGKTTQGKSPHGDYILVDVAGTYNKPIGPPVLQKTEPMPDARMLGVILQVKEKGNYFLKLTGPKKTVTAAADALRNSFGGDAKGEKPYAQAEEE